MKVSRFTDEQRVRIVREADKAKVADVIKKHGISEPTFYAWKREFGGWTSPRPRSFARSRPRTVG